MALGFGSEVLDEKHDHDGADDRRERGRDAERADGV